MSQEIGGYNFAYLDEQTKRMIRRALLKAVAMPGHQVPFGSREMPLPYGWGTGGIQVTAAVLGADDVLKVIDQGADDTTNAVSIRRFFARTAGVATTTRTSEATVIQTRHRIPEQPLREDQILVYQVPMPEPMAKLEPSRAETRRMHGLSDYGLMHVKLYEEVRQSEDAPDGGAAAVRRRAGEADLCHSPVYRRAVIGFRGPSVPRHPRAASMRAVRGR